MANPQLQDWQCPPQADPESKRLGWLRECQEDGEISKQANRGHADYRQFMDVIAGRIDSDDLLDYRSSVNTNELKTNVRWAIAAMSKLRPIWGYSSSNQMYKKVTEMMNKVSQCVYLQTEGSGPADRSIRKALQWAGATSKGWVRPIYRRDLLTGKGNIHHLTYGDPSIIPVQMPASNNPQEAYAIHILEEMPIFMAHAMFPRFQDRLLPTNSKYWYDADINKASKDNARWWNRMTNWGSKAVRGKRDRTNLYVPIRYTYIQDFTLNETDQEIPMGDPGTSWFYRVPFMGQEIQRHGSTIKANENHCRLYPMRRLMISTQDCLIYDGTAFEWSARVPLIPFTFDEWAWGDCFGLVHDGYDLQRTMTAIERGSADKIKAQMDMPLGYDINAVTKKEAEQFDPMQPRARVGFDGLAGDMPFKEVVPPETYKISSETVAFHQLLSAGMKRNFMLNELIQLAKTRALGSGSDNIEQILGAVGPIVEDMSRSMEAPMAEWGEQEKWLILQYFDTARIMKYGGTDAVPEELFDYDPSSIVPSHLPGENPDSGESRYTKIERAKTFAENLKFQVRPHSLHELTQMQQKLLLLQFKKAGGKLASSTIAEAFNIPNYGEFPGATELEKAQAEMEYDIEMAGRMKEVAGGSGLLPPGAAAPGKNPEGRPPTNAHPPRLAQKDNGARSTITTAQ